MKGTLKANISGIVILLNKLRGIHFYRPHNLLQLVLHADMGAAVLSPSRGCGGLQTHQGPGDLLQCTAFMRNEGA
jgi:hypothetical protein